MSDSYEDLEASIAAWAQTQPTIRAIIVIGSRARGTPDRWSDLDLLIFTTERERYAADPGWLNTFGEVVVIYLEDTEANDPEWYVIYEGGQKVDAVLMKIDDATLDLETLLKPFDDWDAFRRGSYVLFDRLGTPRRLPTAPFTPPTPPTAAEFAHVVSGLLIEATTTAKLIRRGDIWRAQYRLPHSLRAYLLTLIEWQAHGRDSWYNGRNIEQWADPRVLAALPTLFALYERESLQQALRAVLDLFRALGEEVGARFGFSYPSEAHDKIVHLIEIIFSEPL